VAGFIDLHDLTQLDDDTARKLAAERLSEMKELRYDRLSSSQKAKLEELVLRMTRILQHHDSRRPTPKQVRRLKERVTALKEAFRRLVADAQNYPWEADDDLLPRFEAVGMTCTSHQTATACG
jgi:hypothetical protein